MITDFLDETEGLVFQRFEQSSRSTGCIPIMPSLYNRKIVDIFFDSDSIFFVFLKFQIKNKKKPFEFTNEIENLFDFG